ncbi:hypothetical protein ACRAVF_19165 [Bradyrhizobium oligotrophicum S58]
MTITIEHLNTKRAALQASLEQLVGQVNRVSGAIAVIDELLQEMRAIAQEKRKEAAELDRSFLDRRDVQALREQLDRDESTFDAVERSRPEMLPVLHEDEAPPAAPADRCTASFEAAVAPPQMLRTAPEGIA